MYISKIKIQLKDSTINLLPCNFLQFTMQSRKQKRTKELSKASSSEIKLPKIPKATMPEDFKIRTRPLFSLPEEILKLPPPPKTSKARTKGASGPRKRSSGNYVSVKNL